MEIFGAFSRISQNIISECFLPGCSKAYESEEEVNCTLIYYAFILATANAAKILLVLFSPWFSERCDTFEIQRKNETIPFWNGDNRYQG